jgi:hypothetical protein
MNRRRIAAFAVSLSVLSVYTIHAADKKPQKPALKTVATAGHECLNSFKDKLKDPESGKVLSFTEPLLVYTATNAYGGRIQGKALCKKGASGWERDRQTEMSQAMEIVTAIATAELKCANSGKVQCTEPGPHSLAEALRSLGYE